jgi:hypothetical protein
MLHILSLEGGFDHKVSISDLLITGGEENVLEYGIRHLFLKISFSSAFAILDPVFLTRIQSCLNDVDHDSRNPLIINILTEMKRKRNIRADVS